MVMHRSDRRLNSADAGFLYFEKPEAPLHMGCIAIVDGHLTVDELFALFERNLQRCPRLQQIVVLDRFGIAHPTWEPDPAFDLVRHIVVLDAPELDDQLLRPYVQRIFRGVLSRAKPLWEAYLVPRLTGDRCALFLKVHHALTDALGGLDFLQAIADGPPDDGTASVRGGPVPRDMMQPDLVDVLMDGLQEGIDRLQEFRTSLESLLRAVPLDGLEPWAQVQAVAQQVGHILPSARQPFVPLPFNRQCTGEHDITWRTWQLSSTWEMARALGGDLDDLVLTVATGAIGRYLQGQEAGIVPEHLRVLLAVSLRQKGDPQGAGNHIGACPLDLPLNLTDTVARFTAIHAIMQAVRQSRLPAGMNAVTALWRVLPAPVQLVFGALSRLPVPAFNLLCAHVAAPSEVLSICGHRLTNLIPVAPVALNAGLSCTFLQYHDRLTLGLTADRGGLADLDLLDDCFAYAFDDVIAASSGRSSQTEA